MTTAQVRIDQARWWALQNQPFYGSLAMSLADVIDPSIDTAATDGKVIRWNPAWVEKLTGEELRFILLHETLHCAHQHLWRLPADRKGNEAGDHEINLTLKKLSGITMPEGGLADPQYEELSCEEILRRLGDDEGEDGGGDGGSGDDGQDQQQQQPSGGQPGDEDEDSGSGGGGKPDPCGSFTAPAADEPGAGDASDSQQQQELRDDWEIRVHQAAQATQALGRGDVPGDMERNLERMRHQTVDWRREMSDFVRDAMSTRNDWSRSARRHAWQPVIYPRRRADDVGTVIFARDTSGSVTDEQASQFTALITDCVSELGCEGIVIDADTRIQDEVRLQPQEECPLTRKGYGGTDFRPVFNRAAELAASGEQIAGIVYLTDLDGPAPEQEPDIATLWIVTPAWRGGYAEAPFGRSVNMEEVPVK